MGQDESPEPRELASHYYRLLVDSVRDYAIFMLDPTGHVMSWNRGAERLKGFTRNDILGRHFSTFYPPEDVASDKPGRELEIAKRLGRVEDEGWRVRKDGTLFWANVIITALFDASNTLVGFAKVTRDLTDRRHAEETLRESEERFRLLVHGVQDYAIFMLSPDGRIASWNEGAQRLKLYRPDEIIGRHFSVFYPASDIAAGKPAWELEVAIRDGKYEEEGWRLRRDGSRFWANVLITAIHTPDGKLIGFAKVTRDLTERRAAHERAVADARRLAEVEAASRTKSEFLTALSHELRTPINGTIGYVELLSLGIGGDVTEQQREYLTRIRTSQEHLLRIVTDLLNYGRIEAGHVQYEVSPLRLHQIVDQVLPMVEPQASAKEVTVGHGPCAPGVMALADRGKAQQVVLNLLSNAAKFTPRGGRIDVACGVRDEMATITVADTGPGIPVDRQADIFEPFVQLGRTLASGHEGTGLGLAISRDLARAMGGDVTVESLPGRGATFTVSLRLA
ncbi:MAG TPA: PAS domain S-box protein [Gemmatimonadaceae bacterium]|nr:PAS domain S-box protein [Gemmatimonadaceae bacterium]